MQRENSSAPARGRSQPTGREPTHKSALSGSVQCTLYELHKNCTHMHTVHVRTVFV